MSNLRHTLHGIYKATAEAVLPHRTQSAITDKGVLTPDEFVQAGDYLVRTCPTWAWDGGDPAKAKPYLPPNKQYLVTRSVPCVKRTSAVDNAAAAEELIGCTGMGAEEDEWVAPQVQRTASGAARGGYDDDDDDIVDIDASGEEVPKTVVADDSKEDEHDEDAIPDIDDLAIDDDDEATVVVQPAPPSNNPTSSSAAATVKTRTYDLMISYDKYYEVPRFWLSGHSEAGIPLTTEQVFEDVTEEHARKTITVDPFPHTSLSVASIHPCRHAHVMTKLGQRLADSGKQLTCDNYLVIFLKFIASIVPNIEYDYTLAASL